MKTELVRCAQCKWWTGWLNDGRRVCEHPLVGAEGEGSFGVYDGEPFNSGSFSCGPEFGCVYIEAKP